MSSTIMKVSHKQNVNMQTSTKGLAALVCDSQTGVPQ